MDMMRIPAALPPAITLSREVAEFCLTENLEAYGTTGPAVLAWRWALTGRGPHRCHCANGTKARRITTRSWMRAGGPTGTRGAAARPGPRLSERGYCWGG
jgi:hypothetical protein